MFAIKNRLYRVLALLLCVGALSMPRHARAWDSGEDVALATFDEALTPYGTWMVLPDLGRVWQPDPAVVGANFRPYVSMGHWIYTTAGWSFASDYPWGWAPFHYGHWVWHEAYGWLWVPDIHWAPAWVDWRYGNGVAGWAPMGIDCMEYGCWSFIDEGYLVSPGFAGYLYSGRAVRVAYEQTPLVAREHGYPYGFGPPAVNVGRAAHTNITAIPVHQSGTLPPAGRTITATGTGPHPAARAEAATSKTPTAQPSRVIHIDPNPKFDAPAKTDRSMQSHGRAARTEAQAQHAGSLTIAHPAEENRPGSMSSSSHSGLSARAELAVPRGETHTTSWSHNSTPLHSSGMSSAPSPGGLHSADVHAVNAAAAPGGHRYEPSGSRAVAHPVSRGGGRR